MVRRLRWSLLVREHWRQLHRQPCTLRGDARVTSHPEQSHSSRGICHHERNRIFDHCCRILRIHYPVWCVHLLRQLPVNKVFISLNLDNAHIAQSRLILLDAALIFFMSLTIYSYVRFRKLRYWYVSCLAHQFTYILTLPQGVFGGVVELAHCHWLLHGLHLGFQGQRHPDSRHYWDCSPDRSMGDIGLSQGLHHG